MHACTFMHSCMHACMHACMQAGRQACTHLCSLNKCLTPPHPLKLKPSRLHHVFSVYLAMAYVLKAACHISVRQRVSSVYFRMSPVSMCAPLALLAVAAARAPGPAAAVLAQISGRDSARADFESDQVTVFVCLSIRTCVRACVRACVHAGRQACTHVCSLNMCLTPTHTL